MFGINISAVLPVRSAPDERSEMTTQLLFGEIFFIEDKKDGFLKITNQSDEYKGWIDKKMASLIHQEQYQALCSPRPVICVPVAEAFDLVNKTIFRLPAGSRLPFCNAYGKFGINGYMYQIHRDFYTENPQPERNTCISTALSFLNTPYLWGGKTIMGMDCSALVQLSFSMNGYNFPRDAKDQFQEGLLIGLEQSSPGDLAFFNNQKNRITHTGIILEDSKIIHASGKVRIDKLTEKGIYSEENETFTHTLHGIKKIFNTEYPPHITELTL